MGGEQGGGGVKGRKGVWVEKEETVFKELIVHHNKTAPSEDTGRFHGGATILDDRYYNSLKEGALILLCSAFNWDL